MPNFDKTGPRGEGPMTGRGIGQQLRSQGIDPQIIDQQDLQGRGRGCGGRGFGRGRNRNSGQNFPGFPLQEETISADPNFGGVGRGGTPWGCGRGRCFGGGR